ncbi:MAG: coproporphyrinogen III oxidase [Micrococcales bacterium]|nr:MAG: coproporphyrinogen III oxidase [Micrococcales bacterium]PIE27515.1 MAG: coproporphyrinogen III oxidase [Micrococcales bacterium]
MPALPDGDIPPADGLLPPAAAAGAKSRDFGVYVHVPFCASRCGYCDFNTYTARELGPGVSQASYAGHAGAEIDWAGAVLRRSSVPDRQVSTVFFGGGTPTLLPAADLVAVLDRIRRQWGLAPGAEVTTEANPDSVSAASLRELADGGFTRVSFGMQSVRAHVLATLERTHDPARIADAVAWAKQAGLSCNLDLIYGTPGESEDDWRASLCAAVDLEPDHISGYALGVEPGTKLAHQVLSGTVAPTDPDDHASKYEIAEFVLSAAGYRWYEISNWSKPGQQCRHNIGYWQGHDWWGIGPGAHSHVGGTRWWNVKHPRQYAQRVAGGLSPAAGREILTSQELCLEQIMLGIRLAGGLDTSCLPDPRIADEVQADGLADVRGDRLVLSLRGRLLADQVVGRLLGW